jgi:DNA-binding transcriptional ArsR family regulator
MPVVTPALQDFKADLFRTLANPLRIRILESLRAAGSLSVTELQQRVGVEPSNISQHLSILRARGLVVPRREGTTIWYSVADERLFELLDVARLLFEGNLAAQTRLLGADPH